MGACDTVLSASGPSARDVGFALARAWAHRRFVNKHGLATLARVLEALGLPHDGSPGVTASDPPASPLSAPFVLVACGDGLAECAPDPAAIAGAATSALMHMPFGGELDVLESLFDDRPITELLETPGALQQVFAQGHVPADLFAGFVVEVCPGEGGHGIADREWLAGLAEAARRWQGLVCVDELQSFGRTGQLYAVEHTAVSPDILWTAPVANLGLTVLRQELACPGFTEGNECSANQAIQQTAINRAWATLHLLTEHPEPVFEGRTLLENSRIKGEYVRMGLAELSAAHPEVLPRFSGLGCLWGLQVEHREEVIATAALMGLKLIGCGAAAEISRIRLVLVADVLTHEIDQIMGALDRVLTSVENDHPDE